ncbi:MAG: hypothetical protein OEY79_00770 [Anaplasmataceae bacterium]|nr:hypothetical protein [Candidatus Heimdallarchaeota archaeon]MDH5796062.1 hypothetical protein [Anaplasmataceae bacterium]
MENFISIIIKILPLYITIIVGYIAGKTIKTEINNIGNFLSYIISPIVLFNSVVNAKLIGVLLSLPIVVFIINSLFCAILYKLPWLNKSNARNIIAYSSGGHTSHLGLPIALVLLKPTDVAIYLLCLMGFSAFENTYGVYFSYKGIINIKYLIKKILSLPYIYTMSSALILKSMHFAMPEQFKDFFLMMRHTYIVLGLSIIGLILSRIKGLDCSWKDIRIILCIKYMIWPIVIFSLIYIDKHYINLYTQNVYNTLLFMACIPLSISTFFAAPVHNYSEDTMSMLLLINVLSTGLLVPLFKIFMPL